MSSTPTKSALPDDFYIDPMALKRLIDKREGELVLLDVRDANELEVCKLSDVLHIPLAQLESRIDELDRDKDHYVVCYAGARAERAASTLIAAGFRNAQVLKGGMKRWVRDVEPTMPIY